MWEENFINENVLRGRSSPSRFNDRRVSNYFTNRNSKDAQRWKSELCVAYPTAVCGSKVVSLKYERDERSSVILNIYPFDTSI